MPLEFKNQQSLRKGTVLSQSRDERAGENRRSGPRVSPTARRPGVRRKCGGCKQSAPETSASKRRPVTKYSTTSSPLTRGHRRSRRVNKKKGRRSPAGDPQPEGWAAGMPYSAAAAGSKVRKGGVTQRLYATPTYATVCVKWSVPRDPSETTSASLAGVAEFVLEIHTHFQRRKRLQRECLVS